MSTNAVNEIVVLANDLGRCIAELESLLLSDGSYFRCPICKSIRKESDSAVGENHCQACEESRHLTPDDGQN